MASPLPGLPDELAGHQVRQGAPSLVLPNGPGYPRIVQAWLWLKKPTWFLDRCSRAYGDVFTMRLPFGINMVHIGRPELVKAVFGVETSGRRDELRRHSLAVTGLGRNPLVLFATRDRRLGSHSPWARFSRAREALHAALVSEIRQRREAPDLGQRSDVLSQL